MKKSGHPKYRKVLFVDSTTGQKFTCGSTIESKATENFEGQDYPVVYLSTSSFSHPFFTGSNKLVDAEGRVDKFNKRYQAVQQKQKIEEEKTAQAKAKKVSKK
ncbi:50S ribosomal protein L31 type B [Candidatus Rubidus massiliensis]|nr:MAG: 50S ribosomal protein L31 [Chlamydia sp. 32-24]CDZ81053.1 50S ribosomal protein L31 type B [Candidatus Rubidus massiliensis]